MHMDIHICIHNIKHNQTYNIDYFITNVLYVKDNQILKCNIRNIPQVRIINESNSDPHI